MMRPGGLRRAGADATGIGRAVAGLLLALLLALRVADWGPLETLRLQAWDALQSLHPRVQREYVVRVVDIDEASLAAHGQWPWPRTLLADLIDKLAGAGAVVIGFDAVFTERDRSSPDVVAATLPQIDEETRSRLRALPRNEDVMARAMRSTRVVLGQAADTRPAPTPAQPGAKSPIARLGPDPGRWLYAYPRLVRSLPELEAAAAGRASIVTEPDRDGAIRRVPAVMTAGGDLVASLPVEMLRVATGTQTVLLKAGATGCDAIVIAGIELATDNTCQLRPRFARFDRGRYLSAADVLAGRSERREIAGRLVLVGSSAAGLFDLRTTPLDRAVPGVEVNAQALEAMVGRQLLARPGQATLVELLIAAAAGLVLIALGPRIGARQLVGLGFGLLALIAAGAWWLFSHHAVLGDATFPMLSTVTSLSLLTIANYLREERQRSMIRSAFSHYVSPALVEQLVREPERLTLGGERRDLTVLLSDVRGFTTISEAYRDDPQGLTRLMNRLLTPLTDAIIGSRGTVDKYMGDAVMAFWNAPLDDDEHPANACRAALAMLTRLEGLNRERRQEAEAAGLPFHAIVIGVGINSGVCTVGNMGSDLRFDYSVLGDTVNIASRLEQLTKAYGVSILVGEATATGAAAAGAGTFLAIDRVRVKGRSVPEEMFALLGPPALGETSVFREARPRFQVLREAYARQRWSDAQIALDDCREAGLAEIGGVLDLYQRRIVKCRGGDVLPPDWDGVWTLAGKDA